LAVVGVALVLAGWQIRGRAQARRQSEVKLAVRNRTEQLERGRQIESARNRILEMLVSNSPLDSVLDAVARLVCDQLPGAHCMVLLKEVRQAPSGRSSRNLGSGDAAPGSGYFQVGAAPGVPEDWLHALSRQPGPPAQSAVPFEVWRQNCDYSRLREEPAWREFVERLSESAVPCPDAELNAAGTIPASIRSLPIGDEGTPLGAILLLYSESPGREDWQGALNGAAHLAQIAIEHRRFCDQLDFQAHNDSLTGLANRSLLDERLDSALAQAKSRGRRLALLYLDVDEFKRINDQYGRRTGDLLLTEVGGRIASLLRAGDTLARVGGDEFNLLLPEIDSGAGAGAFAARLIEAARQPIALNGEDLTVTMSVGIAIYPDDGRSASELQRQADAAMYYAKSLGKNRVQMFSENAATLDSVRIEQDLRRGLEGGWFTAHYQPKFTAEGRLAGMEALIRMNHPEHGQMPPGKFIPVAEATGLIVPIGAWILDEVCRQIAVWRSRGLSPVTIAVNVSALQISRADFAKSVATCLEKHTLPSSCLELEVTESMLINPDSEEHRQMQLLRAMGVHISIDDFGTGFSSLSYLNRLQVDAVKLDRSFVQTIESDSAAQKIVRAMIAVARGLGLDVIAEGVETEAQRLQLVAAGCPVMQGYLFSRPCSPEAVEVLLRPGTSGDDLSRLYGKLGKMYPAVTAPVSV
jgi:diguanylate cyclase (GGDEF)-like protein